MRVFIYELMAIIIVVLNKVELIFSPAECTTWHCLEYRSIFFLFEKLNFSNFILLLLQILISCLVILLAVESWNRCGFIR